MNVRVVLALCAVSVCFAQTLSDWSTHGEAMDDVVLSQSALDNDVIASVQRRGMGWQAGRNEYFEGMSLGDAKALMGTLQDINNEHTLPTRPGLPLTMERVGAPASFDWRTDPRASKCDSIKEIRDQSNCGSCWAFGAVEAMTDRLCIHSNGSDTTHLSAQDVTSCDHLGDMGCNGGIPGSAYTYYALEGVVTGGDYGDKSGCWSYQLAPCSHHVNSSKYPACPDSTKAPACARQCPDDGKTWAASKVHGGKHYSVCGQSLNSLNVTGSLSDLTGACAEAMAAEIYANGPVTGMFFVHQDFLAYKSGVYKSKLTSPMLGGHAIKIMGYGTEAGEDYWLVANSWNEDWGDHGYFKIARGHNECQIENAMINGGPVAGMPKV